MQLRKLLTCTWLLLFFCFSAQADLGANPKFSNPKIYINKFKLEGGESLRKEKGQEEALNQIINEAWYKWLGQVIINGQRHRKQSEMIQN